MPGASSERRWPSTTSNSSTGSTSTQHRSEGANERSVALATTAAQCRGTKTPTPPMQLVDQCQRKAAARHPDGVTNSDGAPIPVHEVVADVELTDRGQPDSCERLVDLEEIDISDGHTSPACDTNPTPPPVTDRGRTRVVCQNSHPPRSEGFSRASTAPAMKDPG